MEVESCGFREVKEERSRGCCKQPATKYSHASSWRDIFCSRGADNAVGAASSKNCKISEGLREREEQLDSRQSFSSSPSPQLSCPLQRKMPGMQRLGWVHLN